MKTKSLWSLVAAGLISVLIVPEVNAAGDAEAGKTKFYTCEGCHGVVGYTNAYPTYHVPRLGGQHADYIVAALKAYRSGQRKHGSMLGNSATMSDQDMQDIGAYVSRFRSINVNLPVTGNAAVGQGKAESCGGCHGEDGNTTDANFPRLAGQHESYLVKALEDYKSGARKNAIMNGIAEGVSEEDMKDIAAFYASQKKGLTIVKE
ncbi:cytochrome c [Methylocaldum sp.]|uniref:c-type cytochrome n=1 Tax=Methylocaldum sp. TaxID=1969727 RepID=UPI002D7031EB|nr:cytochrome c [Methylocaldum sp.]HYE34948.1 cytochrome c [Methylocaldum sp.]